MKERKIEIKTYIPQPLPEVFAFFSKAGNLNLLTPPFLDFKILTPGIFNIKKGTLIDYRLKLFGLPFLWKTEITEYEDLKKFTDSQIKGPYNKWIHQHIFEEKDNGTEMTDIVTYSVPGGILEPIIHSMIVKKNLESIFQYRSQKCKEIFNE